MSEGGSVGEEGMGGRGDRKEGIELVSVCLLCVLCASVVKFLILEAEENEEILFSNYHNDRAL